MNICFVSDVFPPNSIGGIERYLFDLTRTLRKKQNIFVVTSSTDKNSIEKKKNLTIYRQTILDESNNKISPEIKSKRLFYLLAKIIKNNNIDVIEAENLYHKDSIHIVLALSQVGSFYNIPIILRVHSDSNDKIDNSIIKFLPWTKIIGVSHYITENIYNLSVPIKKLATIYPGIDTSLFNPNLGKDWLRSRVDVNDKDILILTASRLIRRKGLMPINLFKEKGIISLLKAMAIVSQKHRNAKLLIAAARPAPVYKDFFEKTVNQIHELSKLYNIEGKVIVHSFNLEEMPHVYNGSDIFILATAREAFGLVFAEAMSCSIPVIGTEVDGVPEIIENGINGYLVHPNNPVELAKRLHWLLDDSSKRRQYGQEGRNKVLQKFDLEKVNERLIGIFNSVLVKRNIN